MNSGYRVEIVPISLEKHPNADSLSIVPIFNGGYICVVRTQDWQGVKLGAYIPPDSLVDVKRPEFSFLAQDAKEDGHARVRAKKLRGTVSYGMLVPAPVDSKEGDDVAERLGVTHYQPGSNHNHGRSGAFLGGEAASGPDLFHVKYDVDAFRRYHHLFVPGEKVVITEKLDGTSSRYVYHNSQMFCGSRNEWKKEYPSYDHLSVDKLVAQGVTVEAAQEVMDRLTSKTRTKNLWWSILECTPTLEKFCRDHPDYIVYGEVFGNTNQIKYGLPEGNRFAAFDIMVDGAWIDFYAAWGMGEENKLPWVPLLSATDGIPYSFDAVTSLAQGQTTISGAKKGTIREGCVVKPMEERTDPHAGRVCFKCVSDDYLSRNFAPPEIDE